MNKSIALCEQKECCACGACVEVCPKSAIIMSEDKYGFVYPQINKSICIGCGLCEKVCAYRKKKKNNLYREAYAVSLKDAELLKKSASGGFFGGIAQQWILEGGIVCGAALIRKEEKLVIQHIFATTLEELEFQLGSKYVQSNLNNTFTETRKYLEQGKKILYSGTPCQIDGLKSYLGKDYDNLLTIDLVCHGVPSVRMFQEYIKVEEKKLGAAIIDYKFRDKESGWGLNAKIIYSIDGEVKSKSMPSYESSYYELFLKSDLYRKNCYSCPYANGNHPADITIGDYWGLEEEHIDYLQPKGKLKVSDGVSAVIINSEKGIKEFEIIKQIFHYYPTNFEKVAKHNEQLRNPSSVGDNREFIFELYEQKGYGAVDKWYWQEKRKNRLKESIKYHVHHNVPEPIRRIAKFIIRGK